MVLGCPKNKADSEAVAGILDQAGFNVVGWDKRADAALLFTCAFVNDAETESVETLVGLEDVKRRGEVGALVVLGCLPQRHRGEKDIINELPEVDAWVGAADYEKLPLILNNVLGGKRHFKIPKRAGFLPSKGSARTRLGEAPYSYLKISDGCRNRCAYCTIPAIRGDFRSRPMSHLVEEAEMLVDAGAKEIVLVGQDTALYGADLYGSGRLGKLLRNIASRIPDTWIRVMYSHPAHFDEKTLKVIAEFPNICPYLDIPIQHAADSVLRRMGRPNSISEIKNIIESAREIIPDVILRTTVIVGFPGETEKEFEELLRFIKAIRFERLGAFAYSREEGTPAYSMKGQAPDKVKLDRLDVVMRTQQEISWEIHQDWEGREMEALVDGPVEDRPGWTSTRSMSQAPEVDGEIYIEDSSLKPGDLLKAHITDALPYDFEAETIPNKTKA